MEIVLGIYAGTTIAAFLMSVISSKAMDERLSREGYKYADEEPKGIAERIQETIKSGLIMLMPGLNFLIGCVAFFGTNSFYKSVLEDGLNDGTIRRKTDEEKEEEKRIRESKRVKKSQKDIAPVQEQTIINKPYSEMSNEEKLAVLEKEKAFLLSVNNQQENKSYNDKGPYIKK